MDPLEWTAAGISALAVWLTTRRNPWCWSLGLVSVMLYAVVFYGARLYNDALLQLVYAVLEGYGWWCWRRARQAGVVPPAGMSADMNADMSADTALVAAPDARPPVQVPAARDILLPLLLGALGAAAMGALTATYTDAAIPWLDATLSAFSLVAQYWMARLYRVNWLLWMLLDAVYVGVYVVRDLPVTAVLYTGFLLLAALGWWHWRPTMAPGSSGERHRKNGQ